MQSLLHVIRWALERVIMMIKERLEQGNIHFFDDITRALDELPSEALFVVDENVHLLTPELSSFLKEKKVLRLKVDESLKTLKTLEIIYDFLFRNHRAEPLVAIGGGITGDLALYAAATFKRGIPMIMIPTTLLSMVDSAVGGKCGVNYHGIKNYIGAFKNPNKIYIAPSFLETLEEREIKCGLGELLKYGLLGDQEIYSALMEGRNLSSLPYPQLIKRALLFKLRVVEQDFRDENHRNILNLGHNTAHGLETMTKGELTHGEAVALGIIVELGLSEKYLGLSSHIRDDLIQMMEKYQMRTRVKILNQDHLIEAMLKDKKNDEAMRFTLLYELGNPKIKIAVKKEDLASAFNEIME